MSIAENEELDDRGMKAWDDGDPRAFADMFAESFVVTDVSTPEPITTRDGVLAYAQAWFTAFPDMRLTQTRRIVTEDAVASEVEFTGTNTGPMMMGDKEIPPTGKAVTGRGAYFVKIENGRATEFHAYPDVAGLMMQLGFMPPM